MSTWIRLSATKDSDGLWDAETCLPIDPKTLPMSEALRVRIAEWMNRYVRENPHGVTDALDDFAADGLAIAEALKAELPAYTVNYHNLCIEEGNPRGRRSSGDNSKPWDYEIE